MSLSVIILAAGQGSRMKSHKPKVLQTLAGQTLIRHVVSTVESLNADNIIVVRGHLGGQVTENLADKSIVWVDQTECLGTGHAVMQALPHIGDNDKVLILYGDVPLISQDTLSHLVDVSSVNDLGILTAVVGDPHGLGRIIRNRFGEVESIVEEKDASDIQRQLKEINTGIYCVGGKLLKKWLPELKNANSQGEYYLTDIVGFASQENVNIKVAHPINEFEILGVNTRAQLAELERMWQRAVAERVMVNGVSLADPDRFDVRGQVTIGCDTWIDINVLIRGNVIIGENCIIGANVILKDCVIGDGVSIKPNSIVDGALIESGAKVGPYARIRPQTVLARDAHIGNFVEVKNAHIGKGSKANHLAYIGDAQVGENCNIGAGVITCNYDGARKHKTILGNDVFVGSDSQLVAPVHIEDGATIGAGSTITKDVPAGKLALTRSLQKVISGWIRPRKEK